MSKISQLAGKGKIVKIGGIDINLEPLAVKDMDLMVKLEDKNKKEAAMKEIIIRTLKNADESVTEEEVENISMEHLQALMDEILTINGLSEEKTQNKFIEKMKQAQARNG